MFIFSRIAIRIGFGFIIMFLAVSFGWSQGKASIKTISSYSYRTDFEFSDEYQYLSTDLYLFNSHKFTNLVNDLNPKQKKNPFWKKVDREIIEYLLITANVKDVKYFGGDLTYPIYNFKADYLNDDGYRVQTDDTDEVIRIFDNLPLHPQRGSIDGKIQGEIITRNNQDRILSMIADQLIGLSELTNPTTASFALIRELGRFMKTSTTKNLYRFSSTIRLYEGQDFSRRFYSIDIYSFMPSHKRHLALDTTLLGSYFHENEEPVISRELLEGMIPYHPYPYFAVVNYKSRYVSEDLLADQINAESIQSHRQKIKKKFEEGTIPSQSTYIQEIQFLDFLERYLEFKTQVNTYRLNEKNQITQDISNILFLVADSYRRLQQEFQRCELEYASEVAYQNSFREKYQQVLDKAALHLEINGPLKQIKTLDTYLSLHEEQPVHQFTSKDLETHLEVLQSLKLPDHQLSSDLARQLTQVRQAIEEELFRQQFVQDLLLLKHEQDFSVAMQQRDLLLEKLSNTHCQPCRIRVEDDIEAFNRRYEQYRAAKLARELTSLQKEARETLYFASFKEHCMLEILQDRFPTEEEAPKHIQLLFENLRNLVVKRHILEELLDRRYEQITSVQNETRLEEYRILIRDLREGYQGMCEKLSDLCLCEVNR